MSDTERLEKAQTQFQILIASALLLDTEPIQAMAEMMNSPIADAMLPMLCQAASEKFGKPLTPEQLKAFVATMKLTLFFVDELKKTAPEPMLNQCTTTP